MACPYFRPLRETAWSEGRAPLGGIFEGECTRGGTCDPRLCNFGYARGVCAHFPLDAVADVVRFSMLGGDRLVWILERDHTPVEHGVLEMKDGEPIGTMDDPMDSQALMFVDAYMRRRA
ncbi:MAG TPA: hypothetical protein VMT15_16660 [Bryobacteraceae bacterium]|nr:hypothetical protein [Bryobacteraceae bacterium]